MSAAVSHRGRVKCLWFVFVFLLAGCEQDESLPEQEITEFHPRKEVTETSLPDFSQITDVSQKKEAFFEFLLPLIEEANAEIILEREQLQAMLNAEKLSATEKSRLHTLVKKYRVNTLGAKAQIRRLLEKVNTLPPSLAMAQAANESAWGTSRFATQGNNLFGQWCFTKGCGLVPEYRADEERHEVAVFRNPYQSVRSYMLNLNRHKEYADLREMRHDEISQLGYNTGLTLAGGLTGYSARGEEYVEELRSMIRYNSLERFDHPSSDQQP